jgi:hypothetical protein
MRAARLIGSAWLLVATLSFGQQAADSEDLAAPTTPDPGVLLPDGPAKPFVLARCNVCHGLEWIARSGGNEEGWTSRIRRMNRAGAMIPPDEVPILSAYLAQALPERLRPVPPPEKRATPSFTSPRGDTR